MQGELSLQTRASQRSKLWSRSLEISCAEVTKKTSLPLTLASMNADSFFEMPEEISETQPADSAQPPAPDGSNWYTSIFSFLSCSTSWSFALKYSRPLSSR